MKFLVDRCAGATLAQWLRSKGHDVAEACEIRLFERLLATHEKDMAGGRLVHLAGLATR